MTDTLPSLPPAPCVRAGRRTRRWGALLFCLCALLAASVPAARASTVPLYGLDYGGGGRYFLLAAGAAQRQAFGSPWQGGAIGQAYQSASDASGLSALYRLYSPSTGDEYFTASASERAYLLGSGYWADEGVSCYVYAAAPSGVVTVPLLNAYNAQTGQHLFTTDQAAYDALPSPWVHYGPQCYLLPLSGNTGSDPVPLYGLDYGGGGRYFLLAAGAAQRQAFGSPWQGGAIGQAYQSASDASGLSALYRLYSPSTGDEYFTASASERAYLLGSGYWADEGVSCYVYAAAPSGVVTVPLLNAYNAQTGQHLFTTDQAAYDALPSPWVHYGPQCYLLPLNSGQPDGVLFAVQQAGGPVVVTSPPSPFTASDSGASYLYRVNATGTPNPTLRVTLTLDYAPAPGDLQKITFNEDSGDQIYTLTSAQMAQAVTTSGRTLTFDSSLLSGANALSPAIPDMTPGAAVTVNAYVNPSTGVTANAGVVQITAQVPVSGQINLTSSGNFALNVDNRSH